MKGNVKQVMACAAFRNSMQWEGVGDETPIFSTIVGKYTYSSSAKDMLLYIARSVCTDLFLN